MVMEVGRVEIRSRGGNRVRGLLEDGEKKGGGRRRESIIMRVCLRAVLCVEIGQVNTN